jgi:hypothetical protein
MKKSEWFRVSPPEIGLYMPYMKEELSSHGRSHWFKSSIAQYNSLLDGDLGRKGRKSRLHGIECEQDCEQLLLSSLHGERRPPCLRNHSRSSNVLQPKIIVSSIMSNFEMKVGNVMRLEATKILYNLLIATQRRKDTGSTSNVVVVKSITYDFAGRTFPIGTLTLSYPDSCRVWRRGEEVPRTVHLIEADGCRVRVPSPAACRSGSTTVVHRALTSPC